MENILALVAATAVLLLIPGPNAALIVANSLRYGLRVGIITALGTTAGLAIQLGFVMLGMAALVEGAASALLWIKWLGVVYLLYLGIKTWNEPVANLDDLQALSHGRVFGRGVLLALINPKTLLFNAAFLPQFVVSDSNVSMQFFFLTGIFLSVVIVGDAMWALFASSARGWLNRYGPLRHKLTGGFLLGAGLGLALSKKGI